MQYASFGTPQLQQEIVEFEKACYLAGRDWGRSHKKLPVHVQIGDRDVQVVRSIHEWAKAFTRGFKETRAK
jgi:hypothetical protein